MQYPSGVRDQFLVTFTSDLLYGTVAQWSADASTPYILGSNLYAAPVTASGLGTDTSATGPAPSSSSGGGGAWTRSLSLS